MMQNAVGTLRIGLVVLACIALAAPVRAQAPGSAGEPDISAFGKEFFAGAAPANAYEMILRLPGFSIVEADADVRGYSAAQGNVLIDGARPASKREDTGQLLKRIPVASVERIELVRSGASGIDMAGHPVLANVIRRRDAVTETALEAGFVASTDGWIAPSAQLEYGRRREGRALDLALAFAPGLDDDSGRGRIRTFSPDGALIDERRTDTRAIKDEGEVSASWRKPVAGGRLTLTGAVRSERARTDTGIVAADSGEPDETIDESEDLLEAEIGARYVRQLGKRTTLEAVASQRLGWLEAEERSREGGSSENFAQRTDTGESIGRIDLTHEWSETWSLNASLEGAFNFLESDTRLEEDGMPVFLPGSDVRIEERRFEAAAGASWRFAERWMAEAGLRVEDSAISQTGDSPLKRRFTYPKPRVALRWEADARNQLRLSLSREVGQLDFEDFVASASLDSGVVTAGNAELAPDKSWRLAAAWEHRFPTDAAITLRWTHDAISDAVDRVLVTAADGEVFDAPGNIGDGQRDTLAFDLSAPLDRFGFNGAHLRSSMLWRRSRVTDPTTGQRRSISKEKPVEASVSLTQDLPALRMHWGIGFDHIAERESKYRFDEISRESEDSGWTVFIERRIGQRWRVRAEATDIGGRDFREIRQKYDGPRSSFPIEEIERRDRNSPGYFSLSFRRSTGG